jgi:hypothetical protein
MLTPSPSLTLTFNKGYAREVVCGYMEDKVLGEVEYGED